MEIGLLSMRYALDFDAIAYISPKSQRLKGTSKDHHYSTRRACAVNGDWAIEYALCARF